MDNNNNPSSNIKLSDEEINERIKKMPKSIGDYLSFVFFVLIGPIAATAILIWGAIVYFPRAEDYYFRMISHDYRDCSESAEFEYQQEVSLACRFAGLPADCKLTSAMKEDLKLGKDRRVNKCRELHLK